MQEITVKIINETLFSLPKYATQGSVGMDLQAHITAPQLLKAGKRMLVPTGIFIQLPEGYEAQIRPRSGLAYQYGIMAIVGTIDHDYIGELKVNLVNLSEEDFQLDPSMRIAQLVVSPIVKVVWQEVTSLEPTKRGAGGFGSTGM